MALKIKISMTVTEDTLEWLDKLSKHMVPHVEISRGDVVDILVAEKVEKAKPGTLMAVFGEKALEQGE